MSERSASVKVGGADREPMYRTLMGAFGFLLPFQSAALYPWHGIHGSLFHHPSNYSFSTKLGAFLI